MQYNFVRKNMLSKIIRFFLENKLVSGLLLIILIVWGIVTAPFGWQTGIIPNDPVPVDAIPDLGENQQIVYTEWNGRSPRDIDDQITYPLTTSLLGIPGVKTIRSSSMFGLSSIYVIFDEDVDFYWARSRILEKLNSLPAGLLPEGVTPTLGPDATALGQVYWYTLEGRDSLGHPAGGWDPQELRSLQDFYVKYALTSVKGVSEVASIGGYVKEYQIDVDPEAMKTYGIDIGQVISAVKNSNLDVGARTLEYNRAEYLIRSLGYIKSVKDLEEAVIVQRKNVPVRLKDIAHIQLGPASRRGGLDKAGTEAVGGVVVARYGTNPMQVIQRVKEKIKEISGALPERKLADGTVSKVSIVPFYDRSGLIMETLGTLEEALSLEILISIIVVLLLVFNLRTSFLISTLLPLGVLMTFIAMRYTGVDANIVALSGIAIAIGVMVDIGIVVTENIIRHKALPQNQSASGKQLLKIIYQATKEVIPAVLTAIATTVVSFLPVFALQEAEGKLFRPLAFTKTFVMLAALLIGTIFLPMLSYLVFSISFNRQKVRKIVNILLGIASVILLFSGHYFIGLIVILLSINNFFSDFWSRKNRPEYVDYINIALIIITVLFALTRQWLPLGVQYSLFTNTLFTALVIGLILIFLSAVIYFYPHILAWALANKMKFLFIPAIIILWGLLAWQGAGKIFGFMPHFVQKTAVWQSFEKTFPAMGKEFMPALNEGSFLLMPTTMPHSGVEENREVIALLDKNVQSIPEVAQVVGKWGRVTSALDPAPVSMFENIINYKPEYAVDAKGRKLRFKTDKNGAFVLKDGSTYNPEDGFRVIDTVQLIPDPDGQYLRQWRKHIKSPDDIWNEIIKRTQIPGLTSAPKLQPIQTRLIMLATGMRAQMGIKIFGTDLKSIEQAGMQMEKLLKNVKGINASSVFADRVIGKPYLEIRLKRKALARYGMQINRLQKYIASAIGGMPLSYSVEGRERYPIRMRYARDFRDSPEDIENLLISTPAKQYVRLKDLADIQYVRGPQIIKSENGFPMSYVIFDKQSGYAETDVVENAQNYLKEMKQKGQLKLPPGVHYEFTGNYENQIRATKRLTLVIPLALLIIFLILYFQFRSVTGALLIFSGIFVAFSGGFIMLWLYSQDWFMNIHLGDLNLRDLFQIRTFNLSVAVWVGFIALFGIATDDGVLISTYIKQLFDKKKPETKAEIREKILLAGKKRVRPAIMTTATTLIALLPVLTSTGKGSDIMIPMAIPIFGGMVIATLTIFMVPVLYSFWQEKLLVPSRKR